MVLVLLEAVVATVQARHRSVVVVGRSRAEDLRPRASNHHLGTVAGLGRDHHHLQEPRS